MNKIYTLTAVLAMALSSSAMASYRVFDEASLQAAVTAANADSSIRKIEFRRNVRINLTSAVTYNNVQSLKLIGNGAVIDGSSVPDDAEGSLVFKTAGNINISRLSIVNSTTQGIFIDLPANASGHDLTVSLNRVNILDSGLFGLHIVEGNGVSGSNVGIELNIRNSNFVGNGTGELDFDGIRVDERADGDISATIINTHIDANGGDGIELDEGGDGNVEVFMAHSTINDNGFFNAVDLEDGFDIDEAGAGDIEVYLVQVDLINNLDEGLDLDEAGEGDLDLRLVRVNAVNNADEGIKLDEEDGGDINARFRKVTSIGSGADGILFTESGVGKIEASFKRVTANDNGDSGINLVQWFIVDEAMPVEAAGKLKARRVKLNGNGNGDEISTVNVNVNAHNYSDWD